jgi:cardiolipin synthase
VAASDAFLDACYRFASETSAEAVDAAIAVLDGTQQWPLDGRLAPDAQERFDALRRAWAAAGHVPSSRELASLLRGVAYATAAERTARRVELVWSGPSVVSSTFRSTEPALLELISSARQEVYVVAFAAYRVPAVAAALQAALARGIRVVFVLETDDSGKVSFDPLPVLQGGGALAAEVYYWPQNMRKRDLRGRHGTLHAKFAVADRERLLVSSANLTEFAFELNIELGVLLRGGTAPTEAAEHVDELIRRGVLCRQVG